MPAIENSIVLSWDERPQDVANLLNPAYVGTLVYRAVVGFGDEANRGMPFPLLFLVPPFVMHEGTRGRLPRSIATTLPTWLQDHKDIIVEFGKRTTTLVPYTRESVLFLLDRNILSFDDNGDFIRGNANPKGVTKYQKISETVQQSYRRAEFVGKWLARSGSPMTIYALLGVTP